MIDLNSAIAPIRPLAQLIGTVLLLAGLADFFGFINVPVGGTGLEIAVAGWLLKSV